MKKCIFCGIDDNTMSQDNGWSIEHIIPYSLGNHCLYIDTVCKKCNNSLGRYVDGYFVDHMFMKMIRYNLKLKSESGKIPNPFEEGIDEDGNRVRLDSNFKPSIVSTLSEKDENHFVGVATSKEQAKTMVSKSLTRKGFEQEIIDGCLSQIDNSKIHEYSPKIHFEFKLEINRFYLAALKIAYEYSFYKLGESYLNDPRAKEIQNVLNNVISGYMKDKCDKIYGVYHLPDEISKHLSLLQDINFHLLLLHPDRENRLICEVILFANVAFSFSVIVSNNSDLYSGLYLVPDEIFLSTSPID